MKIIQKVVIVISIIFTISLQARELNISLRSYPSLKRLDINVNENLFRTPDGEPGLHGEYFNNNKFKGEPTLVRTDETVDFDFDFRDDDRRILPAATFPENLCVRWTGIFGPVPVDGDYLFEVNSGDFVRLWVDDELVIDYWRPHPPEWDRGMVHLEKGQTANLRLELKKHGGRALCRLRWRMFEPPPATGHAKVTLRNERGTVFVEKDVDWSPPSAQYAIDTGELPGGKYEVLFAPTDGFEPVDARFVRERFVWEGNDIGITDEVLPPFEPVKVEDDMIDVVMRKYRLDGLGLCSSVEARGNETEYRELLAAPMRLVANGRALEGSGKFIETESDKVVYKGEASAPGAKVNTITTTEFDGCMKFELTLAPIDQKDRTEHSEHLLNSLVLEIPLKNDMVPLWHLSYMGLRRNPTGFTPAGDGIVWKSEGGNHPGRPHVNHHRRGNWEPYIWLGAEERGLAWFADNDSGWVPDYENNAPSLTLERRDGVLTLRVNLVQKPIVLDEPRTIVFGLMASPAKPMPENWRNILLGNMWSYAGKIPGYRTFDWMGSQYWGSDQVFAAKYPVNKDFSIINKMQEAALTGRPGLEPFIDIWAEKNLGEDYAPKGRSHTREQMIRLADVSLQWARRQPGDMTVYWEEFVCVSWNHPELETYGVEWTGGHHHNTPNITDSYRDFACWYGAEFLRRGIGLYFDNTFMEPAYDPVTTTAYVQPDGHVQPTAGIWARRDYLRRIWTLHRQLAPAGTHPRMVLHMTNTQILPYMVWNDSNLDLEWRDTALPRQTAFEPDFLRAESLGLQTGNIPQALAFNEARADVSFFGSMMVHEIRSWFTNERARDMLQKMLEFGYGRGAKVVNYWVDDPPVRVDDPQCKWLLMENDGKLMILLCTWNENEQTVRFNLSDLFITDTCNTVIDAVTGEALSDYKNNSFSFQLEGYGTRLLSIE